VHCWHAKGACATPNKKERKQAYQLVPNEKVALDTGQTASSQNVLLVYY